MWKKWKKPGPFISAGEVPGAAHAQQHHEVASRLAEPEPPATMVHVSSTSHGQLKMCNICFEYCQITADPWMSTWSRLNARTPTHGRVADWTRDLLPYMLDKDNPPPKEPPPAGVFLKPCRHSYCGVCLAQHIYSRINIIFKPEMYGKILKDEVKSISPNFGSVIFPVDCPACQAVGSKQRPLEIQDDVAEVVLGRPNMGEWRHAKTLSTLNFMYCPICSEDNYFPADMANLRLQCMGCHRILCKSCKSVWHEHMTCRQYQDIPIAERAPDDAPFFDLANNRNWRQCPKCSRMVELKFGCNHITCHCNHHFCYRCGSDYEYRNGVRRCVRGDECNNEERPRWT
ncbi:hypothetical protein FB45DRAFT_908161 [Roridomyces roridus]|uniref:RING-type domain-containing protein n=1 Tax=Roridomyces roridus TaxID=1738132 RepID=A0AAD7C466_9AGAR|nr:hypothetical protein FB45DRAFT_908161 [Roridomyces roridus]